MLIKYSVVHLKTYLTLYVNYVSIKVGKIIIKYTRNPLFPKNWGSLLVGYLEKSVKAMNPTKC